MDKMSKKNKKKTGKGLNVLNVSLLGYSVTAEYASKASAKSESLAEENAPKFLPLLPWICSFILYPVFQILA